MRVGTVISSEVFEQARQPAYKLVIDFGPLGIKKSSAQITDRYKPEELIGKQIIAVVNFPPKQIATMMSECLVLGAIDDQQHVTVLSIDKAVKNGLRIA